MITFLADLYRRAAAWLHRKIAVRPAWFSGASYPGWFVDNYRHRHEPSAFDLLQELKGVAWACAAVNAAACARYPPRLYVSTAANQPAARCLTRRLSTAEEERLRSLPYLDARTKAAETITEVTSHPLLTLLQQVNPVHNQFDLWELTQLYLEFHGSAYWLLEVDDVLGVPVRIWILPSQYVRPCRDTDSPRLVDYFEYTANGMVTRFAPEDVIHFRCPDPRAPYTGGLSPLRACYEQAVLLSCYQARRRSLHDNTALPGVILSPAETIGQDERDRLEEQWNQKFRRGGAGKALISETGLKMDLVTHSLGDLAALAEMKATREDVANCFQVPLPLLSSETNLANLQAADHLHKSLAIVPRLRRRDEKLNEQLIPFYDPSGRLFLASDDPTPQNQEWLLKQCESDLKYGVRTVNEVRSDRGLPPVPWGNVPWVPPRISITEPL
jgi:HK97 family phage portal protein